MKEILKNTFSATNCLVNSGILIACVLFDLVMAIVTYVTKDKREA